MSARSVVAPYARALLDVAVKDGRAEQVQVELDGVAHLLTNHQELQQVLTHPAVPVAVKRNVVRQLVERMTVAPPLGKLLLLLADRDRLGLLHELRESYHERLMEMQRVIRAEVTTAAPMPDERLEGLRKRLGEITGREVTMTTRVDPSLIGGIVTRIGSTVYDGSVATQLATIRRKLAGDV